MFGCCKNIDAIQPVDKASLPSRTREKNIDIKCTKPNDFEKIAQTMVDNKIITQDDANTQLSAIQQFQQGKLSYAEMRMIAG